MSFKFLENRWITIGLIAFNLGWLSWFLHPLDQSWGDPEKHASLSCPLETNCNCEDFQYWELSQQQLLRDVGDPHKLDGNNNGIACEELYRKHRACLIKTLAANRVCGQYQQQLNRWDRYLSKNTDDSG